MVRWSIGPRDFGFVRVLWLVRERGVSREDFADVGWLVCDFVRSNCADWANARKVFVAQLREWSRKVRAGPLTSLPAVAKRKRPQRAAGGWAGRNSKSGGHEIFPASYRPLPDCLHGRRSGAGSLIRHPINVTATMDGNSRRCFCRRRKRKTRGAAKVFVRCSCNISSYYTNNVTRETSQRWFVVMAGKTWWCPRRDSNARPSA